MAVTFDAATVTMYYICASVLNVPVNNYGDHIVEGSIMTEFILPYMHAKVSHMIISHDLT